MRRALGYTMLGMIPVAIVAFLTWDLGWPGFLAAIGSIAVTIAGAGWVLLACWLIER